MTFLLQIDSVLPPAEYYKIPESATRIIDTDFNPQGNGSVAAGRVSMVAGIPVMMSNNVPQSNVASSPSGTNNSYAGDDSKTLGMVFHKSAVGTVKLQDMTTEISGADYGIMYQSTLLLAKYALWAWNPKTRVCSNNQIVCFIIYQIPKMGYSIIRYPFFLCPQVRERMVLRLEDLNLKRKRRQKSLLLKTNSWH